MLSFLVDHRGEQAVFTGRHAVSQLGRRGPRPGPHDLPGPQGLDHGHADGARPPDGDPPGPHRPDDGGRGVGDERVHPRLARASTGRVRAAAGRWASRRRSSSGATTTTAATRRGSGGPTGATTSSPGSQVRAGLEPAGRGHPPSAATDISRGGRPSAGDTPARDRPPARRRQRHPRRMAAKPGRERLPLIASGPRSDSDLARAALGQGRAAGRRAGGQAAGDAGGERGPRRGGGPRGARPPPGRDGPADRHRARDDEGRGDEARAGDVVPRRRPRPRGVPRGVPAQARRAARLGAEGLVQEHAQGDRGRVRRADRRRCSPSSTRSRSPPPRSARSTGRASPDGREVAVKVQYPGVAAAVRSDMQNLGMIMRLMKRVAPGLDARAIAEEIRVRIGEELDYELEASNQRAMARVFRGPPVHLRPRGRRVAVARAGDGHRVRPGPRVRGAQGRAPGRAGPPRGDRLPLLLRLHVPPPPVLRRPPSGQLHAPRRRPRGLPRLRPLQADRRVGRRVRARGPAPDRRRRRGGARSGTWRPAASWPSPTRYEPGADHRPGPRHDVVVHRGPGGRAASRRSPPR